MMNLTQDERWELEEIIRRAWSDDYGEGLFASLMIDVANPQKLSKILYERARDIEPDDYSLAQQLRYYGAKIVGRKPSQASEAQMKAYRASKGYI